ncbi:hypothetical protein Q7P36_001325 [Cladosporium allicinum]
MPPRRSHHAELPRGRYRPILPRQSEAQAAEQARAMALGDPVQPAPDTTDHFPNADFGQFDDFTLAQGLIYPPQFQTQMFQQPHDAMLSPHNATGWEGQMQSGWGRISGRNAAGVGQPSVDTPITQMSGMGNTAAPHGDMGLVSPASSEPQQLPMLNNMGQCQCLFSSFDLASSMPDMPAMPLIPFNGMFVPHHINQHQELPSLHSTSLHHTLFLFLFHFHLQHRPSPEPSIINTIHHQHYPSPTLSTIIDT